MLQSLLKRAPKSPLLQHMTGGVSQYVRPRDPSIKKFPLNILNHSNKFQKSLYAIFGGTTLATVGTVSYATIDKVHLDKAESQRQATDAYEFLKREMDLPINDLLDDWEQLIFVVKCAIKIKESKEQLFTARKNEEALLEESMASDQVLQQKADSLFHAKAEEILAKFKMELDLQVAEAHVRAEEDFKHKLRELKESAAVEQDREVWSQKILLAQELTDAFHKLRSEYEEVATEVEKTLCEKQRDIQICEKTLIENRTMADLRNECQALETLLLCDEGFSRNWCERLSSLDLLMDALNASKLEDDPLVQVVLRTLPDEAIQRGVMSVVALKQRFGTVEPTAHRLALLKREGSHNGLMYALSYLRSMCTIRSAYSTSVQPEITIDSDNADILFKARHCVDNGDILSAVRLLEHLHGAPRSVVSGWLQEAYMLLKVRLATLVLKNYATLKIQRSV